MIPSLFPLFDFQDSALHDGSEVAATPFCRAKMAEGKCAGHYDALRYKAEGFYECPWGFTTRTFLVDGRRWAITGVIAFPRFGSSEERSRAKQFSANKVARKTIDQAIDFLRGAGKYKAQIIQEAAKVLPQAFHELRKLNRAVLQHAEREADDRGESRNLVSIKSAAELMRNNFDILEALANIEGIKDLPGNDTIHLFDLVFKMKRIYQEKASERGVSISVNGVQALIRGSQKSFPIVPAVLLENAIKYGVAGRNIRATVSASGTEAVLAVENESDFFIDPLTCFDHGERFTDQVEGGGFGLFLAREVVHAHGGTIACESGGKLVRMIVKLPLVHVIQ